MTALPVAPGVNLPRNASAEPGIAAAPDGRLWIATNILPGGADPRASKSGLPLAGSDVYSSRDGGATFQFVGAPFNSDSSTAGAGGGDTDIAVAPVRNAQGDYNVYVASLYLANTSSAWSADSGRTWTVLPVIGAPAEDREWLAADGPCTVYVGYKQVGTSLPLVTTLDVCAPAGSSATSALNPQDTKHFAAGGPLFQSNLFGKLMVDTSPTSRFRHRIYFPLSNCQFDEVAAHADELRPGRWDCSGKTQLLVSISRDGGRTFRTSQVALAKNGHRGFNSVSLSVDAAGTVYFAWFDNSNSFLNVSRDGGQTWTASRQINPKGTTAVWPTVAAGRPGHVDIAYLHAPVAGDTNDAARMGVAGARTSAGWRVFDARSNDGGRTISARPMSPVMHRGVLCTVGPECTDPDSRSFLDCFGAVIDPRTGRLTATFTNDQPGGGFRNSHSVYVTELGGSR
jgi:hypothetical protein